MRKTTNRWALAVLALAVLLGPSGAFSKTKVLVLKTQSEALGDAERSAATTVIRDELAKYPKVELLDTPDVDLFEVMLELECTDLDAECLSGMGKKWQAERVVYSKAETADGKLSLKLLVVDVKKGKAASEESGVAADKAGLPDALGKLVLAAFGPLPAAPVEPPQKPVLVEVSSNVEGASVYLNGEMAGRTPFKIRLRPGRYQVKITKDDYVDLADELAVGQTAQTVNFELKKKPAATVVVPDQPDKPDGPTVATPFYKTWWFWTVIGVGVAGIVTTAVVLSVDDEPAATGVMHFNMSNQEHDPLLIREAWK